MSELTRVNPMDKYKEPHFRMAVIIMREQIIIGNKKLNPNEPWRDTNEIMRHLNEVGITYKQINLQIVEIPPLEE